MEKLKIDQYLELLDDYPKHLRGEVLEILKITNLERLNHNMERAFVLTKNDSVPTALEALKLSVESSTSTLVDSLSDFVEDIIKSGK